MRRQPVAAVADRAPVEVEIEDRVDVDEIGNRRRVLLGAEPVAGAVGGLAVLGQDAGQGRVDRGAAAGRDGCAHGRAGEEAQRIGEALLQRRLTGEEVRLLQPDVGIGRPERRGVAVVEAELGRGRAGSATGDWAPPGHGSTEPNRQTADADRAPATPSVASG